MSKSMCIGNLVTFVNKAKYVLYYINVYRQIKLYTCAIQDCCFYFSHYSHLLATLAVATGILFDKVCGPTLRNRFGNLSMPALYRDLCTRMITQTCRVNQQYVISHKEYSGKNYYHSYSSFFVKCE